MPATRFARLACGVLFLIGPISGDAAWAADVFSISSPAFSPGKPIPSRYAFAQDNVSPELHIANIPKKARSLALIVDDPDAPMGLWTHWLVWNLPAVTTSLPEGAPLPGQACEGKNSFGQVRYDGPAPPSGTHRYFFHLYVLDTVLSLSAGADRAALEAAMKGHILARAQMFGTYQHGANPPP